MNTAVTFIDVNHLKVSLIFHYDIRIPTEKLIFAIVTQDVLAIDKNQFKELPILHLLK